MQLRSRGCGVVLLGAAVFASSGRLAAQSPRERFWLAGQYDGSRVIVYFDPVTFGGTFPKTAKRIPRPAADSFFVPMGLTAADVARFQKVPGADRFQIGDRFDILSGHGARVTAKLTSLVGYLSDEQVGNDSYIGGLLTVDNPDFFVGGGQYYAVRRHLETPPPVRSRPPDMTLHRAGLESTPVRFDMVGRIASILTQRAQSDGTSRGAVAEAPFIAVDTFTLADGSVRYYARAEWRGTPTPKNMPDAAIGAWMRDRPLQILATQDPTPADWSAGFASDFPVLLNVVQLDAHRTALLLSIAHEDGRELRLVEYQDGLSLDDMPRLQSLSVGE